MNLSLTEEQKALQNMVRDFARKEITPNVEKWEEEGEFRRDLMRRMGELGFFGCPYPEKYGGTEMGVVSQVIIIEEVISAWIGAGLPFNQQAMAVPRAIYLWGNEEQKINYLTRLIKGEYIGGLGLTEPDVGSDAVNIKTRAVRDGNYYVLNGTKMWLTLATVGDIAVVYAKTDPAAGAKGVSAFIVPLNLPGITKSKIKCSIGTNCVPSAEVVFEDVRVPKENLLGNEGDGFKVAMSSLEYGRIAISARCVGVARAALETAVNYANERVAFGQVIGKFQMIQRLIAEMAVEVDAARLMAYRAAHLADIGEPFNLEGSMAKFFAAEVCKRVAHSCVEIHGAYGMAEEYKPVRYEAFANLMRCAEGPANIQRILIAEDVLGYKKANRHGPKKLA